MNQENLNQMTTVELIAHLKEEMAELAGMSPLSLATGGLPEGKADTILSICKTFLLKTDDRITSLETKVDTLKDIVESRG